MKFKIVTKPVMVLVSSIVVSACGQAAMQQQPVQTYETMTVATSAKELRTSYSATIRGQQDVYIYPQLSGTLTKLC